MTASSTPIHSHLLRGKALLARVLSSPLIGRLIAGMFSNRIPFMGLRIDTHHQSFTPSVKARIFWQIYESAECRFIRRYLRGASCAIELGSSLGVGSTVLASVMRDGGRLLCVEANPALVPVVEASLVQYQHVKHLRVEVVHAMVTDRSGPALLLVDSETMSSHLPQNSEEVDRSIEVPGITLSELVCRSGCEDYVLVSDIEGAEAGFVGDSKVLNSCRLIVMELHDTISAGVQTKAEDLLDTLLGHGFELVDRHGPVVVLRGLPLSSGSCKNDEQSSRQSRPRTERPKDSV